MKTKNLEAKKYLAENWSTVILLEVIFRQRLVFAAKYAEDFTLKDMRKELNAALLANILFKNWPRDGIKALSENEIELLWNQFGHYPTLDSLSKILVLGLAQSAFDDSWKGMSFWMLENSQTMAYDLHSKINTAFKKHAKDYIKSGWAQAVEQGLMTPEELLQDPEPLSPQPENFAPGYW